MKDDLQIKIAADLADTDAPENLSGKRASDFVAQTVGKKKTIPFAVWGGSAIAVAASVVFAIVLLSPKDSQTFGCILSKLFFIIIFLIFLSNV